MSANFTRRLNFACYRCPDGYEKCTYLGPDIPADACPKHGQEAIYSQTGRHYQSVETSQPGTGYEHPDERSEP